MSGNIIMSKDKGDLKKMKNLINLHSIQFMTKEKNGTEDGLFIPDFDKMIENASCKEEIEAIKRTQKLLTNKSWKNGFTFEIVFMTYCLTQKYDLQKGTQEEVMAWTMHQHPWYQKNGKKLSKEEMINEIVKLFK